MSNTSPKSISDSYPEAHITKDTTLPPLALGTPRGASVQGMNPAQRTGPRLFQASSRSYLQELDHYGDGSQTPIVRTEQRGRMTSPDSHESTDESVNDVPQTFAEYLRLQLNNADPIVVDDQTMDQPGRHHSSDSAEAFRPAAPASIRRPRIPGRQQGSKVKGTRVEKDFIVAPPQLTYATLEEAQSMHQSRVSLTLIGPDDVDVVERHAATYVRRMLAAFDVREQNDPPDASNRSREELAYFRQWQIDSHNAVVFKLQEKLPLNPAFVEERVWHVLGLVIDMHRNGALEIETDNITSRSDLTLKCSLRVEAIIKAIQQYTIVRLDVLRRVRMDLLVANPGGFVQRKLTNVYVNQKKKAKIVALHESTPQRAGEANPVAEDQEGESDQLTISNEDGQLAARTTVSTKKRSSQEASDSDADWQEPEHDAPRSRKKGRNTH